MSNVTDADVRWPLGAPLSSDWFALREAVRAWQPDLIVAVARKMPRIDEAAGLDLAAVATTISDLAIPFCAPFIRGARVAVIDDSVNVGSTVRHAAEALRELGATEVEAFALYSREKERVELDDQGTKLRLVADEPYNHRLWREIAAQAPMLISRLNKPYDLDFPVIPCELTTPLADAADLIAELHQRFDDNVFDVTTAVGRELGMHRFSIDRVNVDGPFSKVRLYFDSHTGHLNVVPMEIAAPLPVTPPEGFPSWASLAFDALIAAAGRTCTDELRARALLFVGSLNAGVEWLLEVSDIIRPSSSTLVDLQEAELIFGPAVRNMSLPSSLVALRGEAIRAERRALDDTTIERTSGPVQDHTESPKGNDTSVSVSAPTSPAFEHVWPLLREQVEAADSTDPIVRAVVIFEGLSRVVGSESTKLYQLDWPYSLDQIVADPYLRLRIGFTAADLTAMFRHGARTERTAEGWRRTTSKVLDRLIDAGMVVPTIAEYNGKYYRVYRKGEAQSREETVDRILRALHEYGSPMSSTRLSKVGVITSFVVPTSSAAHVAPYQRGNVLAFDADLLDDETEMSRFLVRNKKIVRQVDSNGD